MKKVKNNIPVYDICSLHNAVQANADLVAEPFASYLEKHPNLHRAHRHSFYHIVLFTRGGGTHTIDFEQFTVRKGQVYFMIPGQVHSWSFKGEVDGYVINFSQQLFKDFLLNPQYFEQFSFMRGIAADSVINLPAISANKAERLMQEIVTEARSTSAFNTDMVRAALVSLLVTVSREVVKSKTITAPPQNQLLLLNFRRLVEQYYTEKHLPKEYAAMLYVTPNHLNALCKDLTGKPAGDLIRDRILLEAKRMLVNMEASIAEIAYKLNFTDNSYFTKFFKKYTGLTPDEFRKAQVVHY